MPEAPLARKMRQAFYDRLRSELVHGPRATATDKADMKAQIMAMVEAAVDKKLRYLRDGQGLGIRLRVEVVNSDLSFRDEPKAANPRNAPEYAEWRNEVYERDGYACVDCGSKGNLQAHHIKEWSRHPDLRFEVSNGQTLCVSCHEKRHPHMAVLRKSRTKNPDHG